MKRKIIYQLKSLLIDRTFFVLLFFTIFSFYAKAQSGDNDPTFNPTDIGFGSGDGLNRYGKVNKTVLQSDGAIIMSGSFTSYNQTPINRIGRLNADGTLDNSFHPGKGPTAIASVYAISAMALQSDGKIIIGGNFTSYYVTPLNHIARLNVDGTLDTTFNTITGANNVVNTTSIQSDGKIIIGGDFTSYNGTTRRAIARLNPDGTLDASFNSDMDVNSTTRSCSIQSDGKIIISGVFVYGVIAKYFVRLNADGTLDDTFDSGTGANDLGVGISAIQSDGKIIIGGQFTTYNGVARSGIARINPNGALDTDFNPGDGATDPVYTCSIQGDGKIIIGGKFTFYNGNLRNNIARLNADGSIDVAFNSGTGASCSNVSEISILTTVLQSDGKIITGGEFTSYDGTIINYNARLNPNGTLDTSFNSGEGANHVVVGGKAATIYTTAIQGNGKIIIGGSFNSYNGITRNNIARLNADGVLDSSFNPGVGANCSSVGNIPILTTATQPDGKIIIGGNFTSYNGIPINHIARLNVDGTLDNTFNPSTGANLAVNTTAIQSDGKIIIGGNFTTYNGIVVNYIARLNTDGTLDDAFTSNGGANGGVSTIAIQSDGKIIIGGEFIFFNGNIRNNIARLNTDGSVDDTFNPGVGVTGESLYGIPISTTTIQPDGKIIIGGDFTCYNGKGRNRIARISNSITDEINTSHLKAVSIYPIPVSNELSIEIVGNNDPV